MDQLKALAELLRIKKIRTDAYRNVRHSALRKLKELQQQERRSEKEPEERQL
jgi:hypothetical protein